MCICLCPTGGLGEESGVGHIYGEKECMGGCLVHRVTCPTRQEVADAEARQVAEK